jgi:hypothetical protein
LPHVCGSASRTTILTDKSDYKQGDTVYLTLKATGNVDHFRVWAKERSYSGTDYIYDSSVPATSVDGSTYEGTCSFKLNHGDVYIYITATTFDFDSVPGPEGEISIYSEQFLPNPDNLNEDGTSGDTFALAPNFTFLIIAFFFIIMLVIIIIIIFIVMIYLKKRKQKNLIAKPRREPEKTTNEMTFPKIVEDKDISKFCRMRRK